MSWGFEIGRVYNRRKDIHGRFGGQQQGGIITPAAHSLVIIITGEDGLQHGYADQYREDGVFEYFGEGQVGDMQIRAGNRAIAEHSANGKGLLLFEKAKKTGLRFVGEMICEGHYYKSAPDTTGAERQAIVFELRALDAITEGVGQESSVAGQALEDLRRLAIDAAMIAPQLPAQGRRNVYQRSKDVRNYVLARSSGMCEGCSEPAPFVREDGSPYLEPHHIRRLSDGGPDHPAHVIALCPNCHRKVHAGKDGREYNETLAIKVRQLEAG